MVMLLNTAEKPPLGLLNKSSGSVHNTMLTSMYRQRYHGMAIDLHSEVESRSSKYK